MKLDNTCDLGDLVREGSTSVTGFRVLPPVFQHHGRRQRFSGPVTTIECVDDNALVKAMLEGDGTADLAGQRTARVLVIDGGASLRRALIGGNLAALATRNGWAGLVVNGCVRDSLELAGCDIGIRALGLMPMPPDKRGTGRTDVPVTVQGVPIRPGDWLVADEDGIVLLSRRPS